MQLAEGTSEKMAAPFQLASAPTGESPVPMRADAASRALLLAVCRLESAPSAHEINLLVSEVREWDSLIATAHEHRVAPLLYDCLTKLGSDLPASTLECLRIDYQTNAFHGIANVVELLALLKVFDREAIDAMPFKGVVLGASVYGDLTTRPAGDLDLLIRFSDLQRTTAILLERGYSLKTPVNEDGSPANQDYFEYRFERPSDGMVVELRWRLELVQPSFRRELGMDWVWPGRRTATVAGAEVPNMSPEITLLMLCMHGSKHAWSRLIWIRDVAQLLAACPELDWEASLREASRVGLRRVAALGLLLAHRVCGAQIPEPILREIQADTTACRLANHFDSSLLDEPGSTPEGRVPYNLLLLDLRDRISMLFSFSFLRPKERDFAAIRLPRLLYPLYYLVRPFRILMDKSARR
jgi:hypothetical protein